MSYRLTDAPDSDVVKLQLSIGQIKVLESLVGFELGDVECGHSSTDEKTLQTLCDTFWRYLHIPLTPEEEKAKRKPFIDAVRAGNEAFQVSINASRGGLENE